MPSNSRAVPISCAQAAVTSGTPALSIFSRTMRRAGQRPVAGDLVGRALRRAAEQDRIVAVIDRDDVHHRLVADVAAVIADPFAERSFRLDVAGLHEALDDDLGIGRQRQAGDRRLDHLDRIAADAADRRRIRRRRRALRSTPSGTTSGRRRRTIATGIGSPRAKYLSRMDAAVLAGRDVEADATSRRGSSPDRCRN